MKSEGELMVRKLNVGELYRLVAVFKDGNQSEQVMKYSGEDDWNINFGMPIKKENTLVKSLIDSVIHGGTRISEQLMEIYNVSINSEYKVLQHIIETGGSKLFIFAKEENKMVDINKGVVDLNIVKEAIEEVNGPTRPTNPMRKKFNFEDLKVKLFQIKLIKRENDLAFGILNGEVVTNFPETPMINYREGYEQFMQVDFEKGELQVYELNFGNQKLYETTHKYFNIDYLSAEDFMKTASEYYHAEAMMHLLKDVVTSYHNGIKPSNALKTPDYYKETEEFKSFLEKTYNILK